MTRLTELAVGLARPRKPLPYLVHLHQTLLRDREGFDQYRDVAQRARDDVHVALVVYHELRHEAVPRVTPEKLRGGSPAPT
jgi:hypothetical protein